MNKKSVGDCVKEFCWKGSSIIPFCPVCMIPLLTERDMRMITNIIKKDEIFNNLHYYYKLAENALSIIIFLASLHLEGKPAALAHFVSSNESIANLMNHRWIMYPVCSGCVNKRGPKFLKIIERNIALSRRFSKYRNVTEDLRKK